MTVFALHATPALSSLLMDTYGNAPHETCLPSIGMKFWLNYIAHAYTSQLDGENYRQLFAAFRCRRPRTLFKLNIQTFLFKGLFNGGRSILLHQGRAESAQPAEPTEPATAI